MSISAASILLALVAVADTPMERFAAPAGFARVSVEPGSFGAYLRSLPLLPVGSPVRTHAGREVAAHAAAVFALDVGEADLQQCADSAMRLYAEWRWGRADAETLVFHATSGDPLPWQRWHRGERPFLLNHRVRWARRAGSDASYASFRAWLDAVFMWAGSRSLSLDTTAVKGAIQPGDLFVLGGSPGHVLVVIDVVERTSEAPGAAIERRYLVGQGFMPAQSIHVVDGVDGPWLVPEPDGGVRVPTWPAPFPLSSARRFSAR